MKVFEILQNSDYAHIFANVLRKKLPEVYNIQHMSGSEYQSKIIYVARDLKGDAFMTSIEVQRLGETFHCSFEYDSVEETKDFRKIDEVYDHIMYIDRHPEQWVDDQRALEL